MAKTSSNPASLSQNGGVISFRGDWLSSSHDRPSVRKFLEANPPAEAVSLNADELGKWDSTLLIAIAQLIREYRNRGRSLQWETLPPGIAKIIRLSQAGAKEPPPSPKQKPSLTERMGTLAQAIYDTIKLMAETIGAIAKGLVDIFAGRSQMRLIDLGTEMIRCGLQALPIISLISFLTGLILAVIGSIPLQWFAAENYVASLIGIGMLRLMAPVMVGVVMAGRNGAAYAAELGAMEVNEEIDALRTLGIDPTAFLILPRFLAMTLMMPGLCIFADILSIYGGLAVATLSLRQTSLSYFTMLCSTTRTNDLFVGLFTTFVLGMCVATCGCYQGMHCKRTAAAVGNAATNAVVYSIVCIVISVTIITILTRQFHY